jgi:hypothetical protein
VVAEGTADPQAAAKARDRVQLTTGAVVAPDRTFGPDDLVAATRYRPVVTGEIVLHTCSGPALDQAGFERRLGEVVAKVDELDLDGAMARVSALEKDLPCSVSPISTRGLHDIFFYTGLLEAYHGERDAAVLDFARAAALKADVPWNTAYAPEAHELYLLGKERAGLPAVALDLVPAADARRVHVDGNAQADARARVLSLRPGFHLLHMETDQGVQRAIGIEVAAGAALYAEVSGAVVAVQEGATDGPRGAAARALLEVAAQAWQADVVYVAHRTGLTFLRPGSAIEAARRPVTPTGDRLGLRVGGGLLLRGAPYRGAPFAYAAPGLELDIATILGLELVAGVHVGFGSAAAGSWSLLPSGSVGLQWAFDGTLVRPFLGAEAVFQPAQAPGVDGGAQLRGGVRISPLRERRLRVAVTGRLGWAGRLTGGVGLSVGFGAGAGARGPVRAR